MFERIPLKINVRNGTDTLYKHNDQYRNQKYIPKRFLFLHSPPHLLMSRICLKNHFECFFQIHSRLWQNSVYQLWKFSSVRYCARASSRLSPSAIAASMASLSALPCQPENNPGSYGHCSYCQRLQLYRNLFYQSLPFPL